MPAVQRARAHGRGRWVLFFLVVVLVVVGFRPVAAWLAERALLAAVVGELCAPPRVTSIDVDLSERRAVFTNVELDAPDHPAVVAIARLELSARPRSLWSDELVFPEILISGVQIDLSAAGGALRSGTEATGRVWSHLSAGQLVIEGASLEGDFAPDRPTRARCVIEQVYCADVRLTLSDAPPPAGIDWVLSDCMIARSTATLTDHGVEPPLTHAFQLAALDLDRVHFPASGPEVLWPMKGGGQMRADGEAGSYYFSGGVNFTRQGANFTLRADCMRLPLPPYSSLLARPLEYGYLTATLHARCRNNRLEATADGEWNRLWFAPEGADTTIYGLREKAVLDLLLAKGNRLEFSGVRITGDLGNSDIDWPAVPRVALEYLLERQLRLELGAPGVLGRLALDAVARGASRREVRAALEKVTPESE